MLIGQHFKGIRQIILLGYVMGLMGCSSNKYSLKEAYDRLENDTFEILQSENVGTIQYKFNQNNGIPVLIVHGISGGYDQGIHTGKSLLPNNQSMLSISRFGYLGSDMPDYPTPSSQSNAFLEVLDYHKIDKVFLLAASAGGTIAFNFSLTYPERVAGILLVSSGYPSDEDVKGAAGPPSFVYRDWIFRFMLNRMQGRMLKMFGVSKEEYRNANYEDKLHLHELFSYILPVKPRKKGILYDQNVTNLHMAKNFDEYPIEQIEAPVLILHARNDPMAKFERVESAMKRFQNVEAKIYNTGGHVLFGHQQANRQYISDFLKKWADR